MSKEERLGLQRWRGHDAANSANLENNFSRFQNVMTYYIGFMQVFYSLAHFTTMSVWQCSLRDQDSDVYVMVKNPTLECFNNAEWAGWASVSILFFLLYSVGFIVVLAALLFTIRKPADRHLGSFASFLVVKYDNEYWWWELCVVLRKFALGIALVFSARPGFDQASVITVILLVALLLNLYTRPYILSAEDLLEIMLLGTTFWAMVVIIFQQPKIMSAGFSDSLLVSVPMMCMVCIAYACLLIVGKVLCLFGCNCLGTGIDDVLENLTSGQGLSLRIQGDDGVHNICGHCQQGEKPSGKARPFSLARARLHSKNSRLFYPVDQGDAAGDPAGPERPNKLLSRFAATEVFQLLSLERLSERILDLSLQAGDNENKEKRTCLSLTTLAAKDRNAYWSLVYIVQSANAAPQASPAPKTPASEAFFAFLAEAFGPEYSRLARTVAQDDSAQAHVSARSKSLHLERMNVPSDLSPHASVPRRGDRPFDVVSFEAAVMRQQRAAAGATPTCRAAATVDSPDGPEGAGTPRTSVLSLRKGRVD